MSDMKSGAELEEGWIGETVYVTVLLKSTTQAVLRPNELSIFRLQNNLRRPSPLRLEVTDFVVQLLADMLLVQFKSTG